MVTRTLVTALLLVPVSLLAQRTPRPELSGEDIIRKGLLRAQATISPGWTLQDGNTNLYLQGDMEYHLEDRISLKGGLSYYLGTVGNSYLKHNHTLLFGAQYHLPYRRFDPYIGLHPGASLIQAQRPGTAIPEQSGPAYSTLKIAPAVCVATGFNFYVWRYLHFMANVSYLHAKHPTEWDGTLALDEIRISFGLGWNVNLIRSGK